MQARIVQEKRCLTIRLSDEGSDPTEAVCRGKDQAYFEMPEGWHIDAVHPDLLGLAVLLLIDTRKVTSLALPKGVSPRFAHQTLQALGVQLSPIDEALSSRNLPRMGRAGLAFGGGTDSLAALALMEPRTPAIYLERRTPPETRTLYRTAGGLRACRQLRERGRAVLVIPSDVEYLRTPTGYQTYWSCGIPAVLLADFLGLDALAVGMNVGNAYNLSWGSFLDVRQREIYRPWAPVFDAAGLPLHLPTAGLSAAATARLVARSPHRDRPYSCVRSETGEPCMACPKCFRKESLWTLAQGKALDESALRMVLRIRKIRSYLRRTPISHTQDLAYLCARYAGDNRTMTLLGHAVRGASPRMDWMEKWFPPSEAVLAPSHRTFTLRRLREEFEPMSSKDIHCFTTWRTPGWRTRVRRTICSWMLRRTLDSWRVARMTRAVVCRLVAWSQGDGGT